MILSKTPSQNLTEKMVRRVIPDVLRGKSRMALAITEPDAGSDVAGLQTEAKTSDDGRHLIINGQKKVRSSARP